MAYLLSVNGSFPVTPYLIWVNRSGADRVIYWVSRYRGRRCHGPMPRQIINKNAIGCAQCGYSCLSCECISIINDHSVSRNDVKCSVKYRCPSLVLCFISCIFGCTEISAVHHKLWKCFFNTLRQRQDGRHFPDGIFKSIFLNENARILIKFSRISSALTMEWRLSCTNPSISSHKYIYIYIYGNVILYVICLKYTGHISNVSNTHSDEDPR